MLLVSPTFAESRYVHVAVSGLGTKADGTGQASGIHDYTPSHLAIQQTYKVVHGVGQSKLKEIVQSLKCKTSEAKKLIITANSWGADAAYRLALLYKKHCHQTVEIFGLVDGVAKPLSPFNKVIPAKKCLNYFQTMGPLRGKKLEGCENIDMTESICGHIQEKITFDCHINAEWYGAMDLQNKLEELLSKN